MDLDIALFADMVKKGRKDLHMTQEELAELLGVSASYWGELERSKNLPSLELFCKSMRTLHLSADYYIYSKENEDNPFYQQLVNLGKQCTDHQLQVLIATATALLKPAESTEVSYLKQSLSASDK